MKKSRVKRRKKLKGYNLHAARVNFSSGLPDSKNKLTPKSIMRSVKYPLVHSDIETVQHVAKMIKSDYRNLYGSWDMESYAEFEEKGENKYSLLDFYFDSLRAGVVIFSSQNKLFYNVALLAKEKNIFEACLGNVNDNIREYFDLDKFTELFLLSGELRKNKSHDKLRGEIISCVFGEFKAKNKDKKEIISESFPKLISFIDIFSKDLVNVIGAGVHAKKEVLERYGVSFDPLNKIDELKILKNPTFYCVPEIDFNLEKKFSGKEKLEVFQEIDILAKKYNFDIKDLIGVSDNKNGLSNYFNKTLSLLREGQTDEISQDLLSMSSLWKNQEAELKRRIEFLSQKAQLLPKTLNFKHYHEHRSTFGGKIESWISNSLNQEIKIKEILEKQLDEFSNTVPRIFKKALPEDKWEIVYRKSQEIISRNKLVSKNINFENLELYRDSLADFRREINFFYMKHILGDQESNEKNSIDRKLKAIFGTIPQVPDFPGESKKKKFESFFRARSGVEHALEIVQLALDQKGVGDFSFEDGEETFLKMLERIRVNGETARSTYFLRKYNKIIKKYYGALPKGYLAREGFKDVFYKSLYSKNNKYQPVISSEFFTKTGKKHLSEQIVKTFSPAGSNTSFEEIYEKVYQSLRLVYENYDVEKCFSVKEAGGEKALEAEQELLDYIEFLKFFASVHLRVYSGSSVEWKSFESYKEEFPKLFAYIDLYEIGSQSGAQLNQVLQSYVFASMRGYVSLYTRNSFISRFILDPVGADKFFNIEYLPKENVGELELGNTKKLRNTPHHWNVSFQLKNSLSEDVKSKTYLLKKKGELVEKQKTKNHSFKIQSSRYQMRFLEDTLDSRFNNRNTGEYTPVELSLSEPSLILEEMVDVTWKNGVPEIGISAHQTRLFFNIPFNLNANEEEVINIKNRYLGVDVGEYGLAYSVIEVLDQNGVDNISLLDSGFLYSGSLRAIRDQYQSIRKRAAKGTFGFPVTALAAVRENAIGSLRNQIHELALKYRAQPVYEWQISNFETGNGKVTKIYDSVKKADTSDIEKNLVWGDKYFTFGREISAYGTSQRCLSCGGCPLSDISDTSEWGYDQQNNIVTVDGVKYYTFLGNNKLSNIKDVKKAIHRFTRPSYRVLEGDDIRRSWIDYQIDFADLHRKRGNQAIFTCPVVGCGAVADCDLQASVVIALRRYFRVKAEHQINPSGKKLTDTLKQKRGLVEREIEYAFFQDISKKDKMKQFIEKLSKFYFK